MSYYRRGGTRFRRRQKVSREEMVKFTRVALTKQRQKDAEARSRMIARWVKRGAILLAAAAFLYLYWRG